MNYPYSTFIFETQRAKERLAKVFQPRSERRTATLSQTHTQSVPRISDRQDAANRIRVLPKFSRRPDDLSQPARKKALLDQSHWTHEDMGTLSFTLTLLLLLTVAAAQTERPVLWLLTGPVPLALGLAVAGFVRPRFSLRAYLRRVLHRFRQNRDRSCVRESGRGQGQCQCQCQ